MPKTDQIPILCSPMLLKDLANTSLPLWFNPNAGLSSSEFVVPFNPVVAAISCILKAQREPKLARGAQRHARNEYGCHAFITHPFLALHSGEERWTRDLKAL